MSVGLDFIRIGDKRRHLKLSFVKEEYSDRMKPVWDLDSISEMDARLIRDLELRLVGRLCAKEGVLGERYDEERFGNGFAYILTAPLTNEHDIREQKGAIEEFSQPDKKKLLEVIINSMYVLGLKKEKVLKIRPWENVTHLRRTLGQRLDFLSNYLTILTALETLSSGSQNGVLRSVEGYVKGLREDPNAVYIPQTVDRATNHLRLNLDIVARLDGKHHFRFKKSEFSPRVSCTELFAHLGHRLKSRTVFMKPYILTVNEALEELIEHNLESIDNTIAMSLDLEFYRAAMEYEGKIADRAKHRIFPAFSENGTAITALENPLALLNWKQAVPNDYAVNCEKRVLLITGANSGGKTFYSRAVSLAHLFAQRGLSIPASKANVELVDAVYTHFSEQSSARDEGAYEHDLRKMDEILSRCSPKSLIIVDDPCHATDPAKGQVQSSYFLEALSETGARVILNSHYHELAKMADSINGVRNMHPDTRFEDGRLINNYTMLEGPAGTSFALELAQSMGLGRERLLEKSRAAKGR